MATIALDTWPDGTEDMFGVTFSDYYIRTTLTADPAVVDDWIADIERIHRRRLHRLVVGLDVEWRPNFNRYSDNPVALLQICVGQICLIFQLLYSPSIPQSLFNFLANESYTFVGVGIDADVERLVEDHGLEVAHAVDLRTLAAERVGTRRDAGLKALAMAVIGVEVEKPRHVTMSRWDAECLSYQQICYACVDAFVSFEIGKRLNASDY